MPNVNGLNYQQRDSGNKQSSSEENQRPIQAHQFALHFKILLGDFVGLLAQINKQRGESLIVRTSF
jgi:hypothetical protein